MGKRWKKWLAAWLAVMACCIAPMGTMQAFGEEESVSQNGAEPADAGEEKQLPQNGTEIETGEPATQDSVEPETETESISQNGLEPVLEEPGPQDGPEITETSSGIGIYYQGSDLTGSFGSGIACDIYIGQAGAHELTITADGDSSYTDSAYCLLSDPSGDGIGEGELADWPSWSPMPDWRIPLDGQADGRYVVGIRAVRDEETVYALSRGFVWDTTPPVITDEAGTEMQDGGTYPAGTTFRIEDISPVDVYMNELPAAAVDGVYTVVTQEGSRSCVVKATDRAGNMKSLSLTIEGEGTPSTPDTVIAESRPYFLQPDTAYTLGEGTWRVEGDPSVYQGGSTFYVQSAGSYWFWEQ